MTLNPKTFARVAWLLLALLCVATAADLWRWQQLRQLNAQIESGRLPSEDPNAAPELRFAHAHAQAASGAVDSALNRYGALQDDSALGRAARFNGANLLLRQGIALRQGAQPGQALALIELAKENYRQVLRVDPQDWPARYNLERAQRALADPEGEDELPAAMNRQAERAATTMRGYSPGLP